MGARKSRDTACTLNSTLTVLLISTCFKSLSHGLRTSVDTKWLSDFNCVADPNYFGALHMLDMTDSDPAHVLLLLTLICSDTIQKIYDNWYYFRASRSGIFSLIIRSDPSYWFLSSSLLVLLPAIFSTKKVLLLLYVCPAAIDLNLTLRNQVFGFGSGKTALSWEPPGKSRNKTGTSRDE